MFLKDQFFNLLKSFDATESTISDLWREIETQYTGTNRYYHSLSHIETMLMELNEVKPRIEDWPTLLFTVYYHDIVYNVHRSDNEMKSAEFAEERIQILDIPKDKIVKCKEQIMATNSLELSKDSDTNYFLDADLSVLGSSGEKYVKYAEEIRKEYSFYPDILYKSGRKKVIQRFLKMDHIYKTDHFYNKYEIRARKNLEWELNNLK